MIALVKAVDKKAKVRAKEHFTIQQHMGQLGTLFDDLLRTDAK